ncbi:FkbM family methyltransferase [Alphaproteobacteria bacterium]|nr:FkbM family methyltransferase [Alphaproteobacteria bacterium]
MQVEKFGTHSLSFLGRVIRIFICLGFARGKFKKIFHYLWKNFIGENAVDLSYNGLKLRVIPFGNSIESNILFSSKTREREELKIIKKFVNQSTLFLDIGANSGYYSVFVSSFGARKCICFEPNPVLVKRINENIELNHFTHKIDIAPFALGDFEGNVTLKIATSGLGNSSINRNIEFVEELEVQQKTLTNALEKFGEVKADIIKIDVEGLEDKILYPYLSKLDENMMPSLIVIEDNAVDWEMNIIEWLKTNGYKQAGKTRGNIFLVKG